MATRTDRTLVKQPVLAAALAGLLLAASPSPASADSQSEPSTLRRHGSVSRFIWAPRAASAQIGGQSLQAGMAIGVRGPLRTALGAAAAPALVLETGRRSNLTLLAAGNGSAMLVWQHRN